MKSQSIFLAAASLFALSAAPALAAEAVALVGDATLVRVDLATGKAGKQIEVSGAGRLLGIDVRPSNKMLYGVATDGSVMTIDTASGAAKKVSKLDTMLPGKPTSAIVDFNPAADRLRFMGQDGTNLRADVDTGAVTKDGSLAFEKDDMHVGEKPNIVAAAYTNSLGKPASTAMYDIDATIGALIQQTRPNDGALKAVGKLGVPKTMNYAFDIQSGPNDMNTAWLVADNTIYKVDIASGKSTMVSKLSGIKGTVRDIAVLAQ